MYQIICLKHHVSIFFVCVVRAYYFRFWIYWEVLLEKYEDKHLSMKYKEYLK